MTLLIALVALGSLQSPAQEPVASTVADETAAASVEADAEGLRARIREMRMNLLLGGDQVRNAEREAVDFYGGKARSVERRMDDVATELSEARASYDVVLDRALSERGGDAEGALREAQPLRARISSLEAEASDLESRRSRLSELVESVEARDRDRRKLVDQMESASAGDEALGLPMMSIGLAPPAMAVAASAPLEDDSLVEDLMRRDPQRAKELLFQADPVGYWDRFPLTPPARTLRSALRFPLPDPPGQR